jgi:error-prone DNA polymerase
VALPQQGEGEEVVADYRATGLTLGRHPLALLRPVLDRLGYGDSRGLGRLRSGAAIRLPGLVLMRQRPGSAKGIVFMTVEDEHGVGNLVIYPDVAARDRSALVAGRLLVAEGRVERQVEHAEVPIIHLVVRRLVDRTDLLGCLNDPGVAAGDGDWVDRMLGRADEVRRPEPGSRRAGPKLPGSRDFR